MPAAMFVQQCLNDHSSGKRTAWYRLKTLDTRNTASNRLFYIQDSNNHLNFLIDTGAQVSVIPLTSVKSTQLKESTLKLQAANVTSIKTYGEKFLKLNIGLRRVFSWIFLIADIDIPILCADFLAYYNLSVELAFRTITDSITKLKQYGIRTSKFMMGLTTLIPKIN